MSLRLQSIDDPRDHLDRTHRKELERYAKENKIPGIKPGMPAVLMRRVLRRAGINDIGIRRTLGQISSQPGVPVLNESSSVSNADDILEREWNGK